MSDKRPLREYRIRFEPVPQGERAIDPSAEGLRSKLGGEPDWVQDDERPNCGECGGRMVFIGQLDSMEHDSPKNPHRINCLSDQQQFMFGDVGMIYVFLCENCNEASAIMQCG